MLRRMSRKRGDPLEKIADLILLDEAQKQGYVVGKTGNRNRGFGQWMRENGMLYPHWEYDIKVHEKTGFSDEQLEDIEEVGVDPETKRRYNG